jgi:S-adenosylmethionine hydrolase
MPIITLISDWGLRDYYAAAVKGHLLTMMPDVTIVDITHTIEPYDLQMTSYILKNAYPCFPKGTVHIIGIETTESIDCKHIAMKLNGHYFVGADNGIPALILDGNEPEKIIELNVLQDSYNYTFSERDLFAKVAVHLAKGLNIEDLGQPQNSLFEKLQAKPLEEKDKIVGTVEYVDNNGNLITNISESTFKKHSKGKSFIINLPCESSISKISTSYQDVDSTDLVAIFNSSGYLEIALNRDNISKLLNIEHDARITITFYEYLNLKP